LVTNVYSYHLISENIGNDHILSVQTSSICTIFGNLKAKHMEKVFDIVENNRVILHRFLTGMSREQLLKIPEGFNNNIWWNIAHVVVTEQLLVYKMNGLPMNIDDALVDKFRKGTTPDGTATDAEIKKIEELMLSLPKQTKTDYENGVFKEFSEYTTSLNVTLSSVEDALSFNVFHEGLHLGSILALKRAIAN